MKDSDTSPVIRIEKDIETDSGAKSIFSYEMAAMVLGEALLHIVKDNPPNKGKKKEQHAETKEYSEFKSDGKRRARPADPIRSYQDFKDIQDYFLSRGSIRDWMMWTIGVSLGLRVSDLLSLKVKDFMTPDIKFKKELWVIEKKTKKKSRVLITEAVVHALKKYFDSIMWIFNQEDYLFISKKTKTRLKEEHAWRILSDAGKALNLPLNLGSHSMRKSFSNIMVVVDNSFVDMNKITTLQGLLSHSDQKTTLRYMGVLKQMLDAAREAVSDFVLGRSNVNELLLMKKHD